MEANTKTQVSNLHQFTTPHIKSCEASCDNCPSEVACGPLHSAITIIEHVQIEDFNADLQEEVATLKNNLKQGGFSYPDGKMDCDLAHNKEQTFALVKKASQLVKKILARQF